jgi:hypothetical protein
VGGAAPLWAPAPPPARDRAPPQLPPAPWDAPRAATKRPREEAGSALASRAANAPEKAMAAKQTAKQRQLSWTAAAPAPARHHGGGGDVVDLSEL